MRIPKHRLKLVDPTGHCDVCKKKVVDHDWVDIDDQANIVDCSNESPK